MSTTAPRACSTCKRQKKKCDKRLPSCSRCLRAISECRYGDEDQSFVVAAFPSDDSSLPRLSLRASDIEYLAIRNAFTQNDTAELHRAANTYALNFFTSNGQSVYTVAEHFFKTVGCWSPMVDRKRLYHNLGIISIIPRADVALLTLCMHVICKVPTRQKQPMMIRNSTYLNAKELISFLQQADTLTIELLQSAVLIAAFEYGHGFLNSAYLSIGMCLRMAHSLGIDGGEFSLADSKVEEERRVWWTIYALDRLIYLSHYPSCSARMPESTISDIPLPAADEMWDQPPDFLSSENLPTSTARNQAIAAQLLGRVIFHTCDAAIDPELKRQQASALSDSIVSFAISTTKSGANWGTNCGALGIIYAAFFRLHQHYIDFTKCRTNPCSSEPSIFEILSFTRLITDIGYKLGPNLNTFDCFPKMPLTIYATYQATIMHVKLSGKDVLKKDWQNDFYALKSLLDGFSKRWALAGNHLSEVEEIYEARLQELITEKKIAFSSKCRAGW